MANMNLVTGYWGEEHVTSNDQGSFNAAILGSGQFVTERGNQLVASIISNNIVRILDGDLMMQGRHIRLNEETYVDLNFDNGAQGFKRNDLIVARYTRDSTTDIESCNLVVIKGVSVESSPVDPTYTAGDILVGHAFQNDMPLYRVPIDGLNIQPLVGLFHTVETLETVIGKVWSETENAILEMQTSVVDNYNDALAVTEDNIPVGCKAFQQLNSNLTAETSKKQILTKYLNAGESYNYVLKIPSIFRPNFFMYGNVSGSPFSLMFAIPTIPDTLSTITTSNIIALSTTPIIKANLHTDGNLRLQITSSSVGGTSYSVVLPNDECEIVYEW